MLRLKNTPEAGPRYIVLKLYVINVYLIYFVYSKVFDYFLSFLNKNECNVFLLYVDQ